MAPKKKQPKHKAGRPKGSVVPIERDRRKYAIAVFWAFHELGRTSFLEIRQRVGFAGVMGLFPVKM